MLGLRRIQRTSVPYVRTFCHRSHRNDKNFTNREIAIITLLYSGGMGGGTYGLVDGYMRSRKDDFFTCVGATTTFGIFGFLSGTGMAMLSPILIPIGCVVYGIRCLDKTIR